jgi:hypothetical protein
MRKLLLILSALLFTPFAEAEVLRHCLTVMDATAQTTSTNGSIVEFKSYDSEALSIVLNATNTAGSTPTLNSKIQSCRTKEASSCYDWYTFSECTTGTCRPVPIDIDKTSVNWFRYFRVVTTIAGTSTPTYDVKVELCYN